MVGKSLVVRATHAAYVVTNTVSQSAVLLCTNVNLSFVLSSCTALK